MDINTVLLSAKIDTANSSFYLRNSRLIITWYEQILIYNCDHGYINQLILRYSAYYPNNFLKAFGPSISVI